MYQDVKCLEIDRRVNLSRKIHPGNTSKVLRLSGNGKNRQVVVKSGITVITAVLNATACQFFLYLKNEPRYCWIASLHYLFADGDQALLRIFNQRWSEYKFKK